MSASIDSIIDLVLFERGYTGTEGTSVAILAALRAAGYVVEWDWQDISTAPRDGTWIITYGADTPISDGFVLDYWPCDEDAWNGNPTHWRPLPAPPGAAT